MNKTTIMLPASLRLQALRQAQKMKISLGELVRTSLDAFLKKCKKPSSTDPLFADRAHFKGKTPQDLSLNHDEYLYGDGS